MLPNFDQTDSDGRKYCEISLPGGTFRMFEDKPFIWNQVLQSGEKSIIQVIEDAFNNGEVKKR